MKRRELLKAMTGGMACVISSATGMVTNAAESVDEATTKNMPLTLLEMLRSHHGERLAEFCGVTHINGAYSFTDENTLIEGARRILELGCRSIKLSTLRPESTYALGAPWEPTWSGAPLAVVQSPPFAEVLAMPFTTINLWAYSAGRSEHYWNAGPITPQQAEDEAEQFYRLAAYLLNNYRGSEKTFILSHWEGDWAIRGNSDATKDPSPEAFAGMRDWLTARQAGVDRARHEYGDSERLKCTVLHAAEVNLVKQALPQHGRRPGVATDVLPYVPLDMVSYSAYDSQHEIDTFPAAMAFLAEHMPPKDGTDQRLGGRVGRVFVGEYGFPENHPHVEQGLLPMVENVLRTATESGCRWTFFWQLYCNEPLRRPVEKNDDCRGFWLVRRDGSETPACQMLREFWKQPSQIPCTA